MLGWCSLSHHCVSLFLWLIFTVKPLGHFRVSKVIMSYSVWFFSARHNGKTFLKYRLIFYFGLTKLCSWGCVLNRLTTILHCKPKTSIRSFKNLHLFCKTSERIKRFEMLIKSVWTKNAKLEPDSKLFCKHKLLFF